MLGELSTFPRRSVHRKLEYDEDSMEKKGFWCKECGALLSKNQICLSSIFLIEKIMKSAENVIGIFETLLALGLRYTLFIVNNPNACATSIILFFHLFL